MSRDHAKRLYTGEQLKASSALALSGNDAHYVSRVLRLKTGDTLRLFDGSGGEHTALIESMTRHAVNLRVGELESIDVESPLTVRLIQGVARNERMDTIVQKATELGVADIYPVVCERSQYAPGGQRAEARCERWQGIARSACQQSGRNRIPRIHPLQSFGEMMETALTGACLILNPQVADRLPTINPNIVQLAVGPEGGFSESELSLATERGWQHIALGPRVLRTETAAIAALSVVQFAYGDLGIP